MKQRYFAGANTKDGFVSYYREVFGPCESVYIIKGGSGTGKSSLIKKAAQLAKDEGHETELFYCSFDPSSLDGVIVGGRVAIIDGTAPHVYEPTIPGAKENLIDLGAFWDADVLRRRRDEIAELMSEKKREFSLAYSYLAAAGELDGVRQKILSRCVKRDSIDAGAAKLISELGAKRDGASRLRIRSSIGKDGRVSFDTYGELAEGQLVVSDSLGAGHIFLDALKAEAERMGRAVMYSYDPLHRGRIDALLIDGLSVALCEGEGDIQMSQYIGLFGSEFDEMTEINKKMKALEAEAAAHLTRASEVHFAVERIYASAMDFERKERETKCAIEKIGKNLL